VPKGSYRFLCKTLDGLFPAPMLPPNNTVIIHGDAAGADRLAGQWATNKMLKVERYPADWAQHGRAAGLIGNKQMLEKASQTSWSRLRWHAASPKGA
jgi:YspA, cpYpsA-related SLOG family